MKDVEHLPCWEITDKILAAFYEVYNTLGSGFLESVYRAALIIVMTRLGLRVEARAVLPVHFESRIIAPVPAGPGHQRTGHRGDHSCPRN
jgi:PD-(D/E)XK nuclease superfamily